MKSLVFMLAVFALTLTSPSPAEEANRDRHPPEELELKVLLQGWSEVFVDKVGADYRASANFQLQQGASSYHVDIGDGEFEVYEGLDDDANFTFVSTLEHYNKLFRGEMTALTSMGQASSSDPIPLAPELHQPVTDNLVNDFLFFSQRFFNRSAHDKVELDVEKSRIVHGGHSIPIFYQKTENLGVRSAWYRIDKGQQVNEPGDTNPFPQYFIVTRGSGYAKLGDDTVSIRENEAYYVAPGSDHVFWNESDNPLEMIFLAWGEGA